jgi:hypothetical protein
VKWVAVGVIWLASGALSVTAILSGWAPADVVGLSASFVSGAAVTTIVIASLGGRADT